MRRAALGLLLIASMPAWSQLMPTPPLGKLWEMRENGDAVQKDLGFIVPKQWKIFERRGFTSTREDGGSTKAYYVSDDKALRLNILLQLRPDIRGLELDSDFVWTLIRMSAEFEYAERTKAKPTELSLADFSLGKRTPAGRARWTRYDLDGGAEVQGTWWQNIGVWSVVITMSGPEARRADLEAQANTLFAEMLFPSAPLATELAVNGEKLLAALPRCQGERPKGSGAEIVPVFKEAAALSLIVPPLVLGKANDVLISPVTHAAHYCVIEKFSAGKDVPVTAIQYSGPATAAWEASYGFIINNGRGGYYQIERLSQEEPLKTMLGEESTRHVYLDFSNNKRASMQSIFDSWPSYDTAKQAIVTLYKGGGKGPLLTMTNPAEKLLIVTNPERIQPEK
jgi:hypothetical protein